MSMFYTKNATKPLLPTCIFLPSVTFSPHSNLKGFQAIQL